MDSQQVSFSEPLQFEGPNNMVQTVDITPFVQQQLQLLVSGQQFNFLIYILRK